MRTTSTEKMAIAHALDVERFSVGTSVDDVDRVRLLAIARAAWFRFSLTGDLSAVRLSYTMSDIALREWIKALALRPGYDAFIREMF